MHATECIYPKHEQNTVVHAQNPHILQADHGSYWFLGANHNTSAFNGLGFLDLSSYHLHSVLYDVRVQDAKVQQLIVRPQVTTRVTTAGTEHFFFRDRLACYSFSGSGTAEFLLDVRDSYDFSPFSREHTWEVISKSPYTVRVCSKGSCFVFVCSAPLTFADKWAECPTSFDEHRSQRATWWAQRFALAHNNIRVVIAPEHRRYEATQVLQDASAWQDPSGTWNNVPVDVALSSVECLITQTPNGAAGILAGLPWFFQIYTRDEAIAVGALIASGKYPLAGRILLRQISVILPDGRIPNRFPHSEKGSADGVGWSFFRLSQLYHQKRSSLTNEQWTFVREQLKTALARLHTGCDGALIESAAQETWMDTTGGVGDTRHGSRVEIQALTLSMFKFCAQLCEDAHDPSADAYRLKEQHVLRFSRKRLIHDGVLVDGCVREIPDKTIRPNALLAHYIYPELLSTKEWINTADSILARIDTHWGGVSTIARDHPLFVEVHTGENDRSYHRGDSWFFINNLVALTLADLDEKYRSFAKRVYEASVHDLLAMGAAGHSSEISSAREQDAWGCWCQAWSASTLVELGLFLR